MVVATSDDKKDKIDVLIIADNFNQKLKPFGEEKPLGLFNVASVTLLDLTMEWVSRIDANVYIAISEIDKDLAEEIRNKWWHYVNVEFLICKTAKSFGDVMRAVDRKHILTKEFILIENVPTFCSSRLTSHLEAFKALRKDRTVNGKTILGKDNLMTMVCSRSKQAHTPVLLEKASSRLLMYCTEKDITLTKKQFATSCVVRSDLKQTGIYFCAPEIITKFSDNIDAQTFEEQIGNIVAQDETICEYIYVDVLPDTIFADTAFDVASLYNILFSFLHQKYYPCTFDTLHPDVNNWGESRALQYRGHFVFLRQKYELPKETRNAVFGGAFTVEEGVRINGGFFGEGIVIGQDSQIEQAVVGKNVKIGKNVNIRYSIISDNAQIEDGAVISGCLILSSNKKIMFKDSQNTPPTKRNIDNRTKSTSSLPAHASEVNLGGINAFDAEVRESMRNSLAASDWNDKERVKSLVLEINSSKLAYNIQIDDLARHVFSSFMAQPQFGPTLDEMKILTDGWHGLWNNYYKPDQSKLQILHAIEDHISLHEGWTKYAPKYVLYLYNDADLLSDEIIIDWFNTLNGAHPLKKDSNFKKLIEWLLADDDEESDEEEDEEDDE